MYKKIKTASILIVLVFVLRGSPAIIQLHTYLPNPDSTEYKQLLEARRLNGLDTSITAMNQLYAEGAKPGFAMSGERLILQSHTDIEGEISNLTSSLSEEHYAGVYVKSAENKIVIQLVDSTAEFREEIINHAKFPESIEFEEVEFTKLRLNNDRNLIEANWNAIGYITSLGVDGLQNRIRVGFNLSEQQTLESRKHIEELINPEVLIYDYNLRPVTF